MWRALVIACALAAVGPAQAADAALDRLTERANACIRNGAPDAERLNPSLNDAAEFLIGYICAREVAARERYRANFSYLESVRRSAAFPVMEGAQPVHSGQELVDEQRRAKDALENARLDPDTGDVIAPAAPSETSGWTLFPPIGFAIGEGPADFRALAGRALLDARNARLKAEAR